MFPDTDERYRGVDSAQLLQTVFDRISGMGYSIENIDCTVIAQAPRLAPFIDRMREKIAGVLDVSPERISVKATTEEHLGFTGSGEGIAAQAVVLLNR